MSKDFQTTVRMNSEVKNIMDRLGISPQSIIDSWVERNIEIKTTVKAKKEKK